MNREDFEQLNVDILQWEKDIWKNELKKNNYLRDYQTKKNDLLINTDFKELKLSNEPMRKAYVENELSDLQNEIDNLDFETKHSHIELRFDERKLKIALAFLQSEG